MLNQAGYDETGQQSVGAGWGGAFMVRHSPRAEFYNCTFADNRSGGIYQEGDAFYAFGSCTEPGQKSLIVNSLFFGTNGLDIQVRSDVNGFSLVSHNAWEEGEFQCSGVVPTEIVTIDGSPFISSENLCLPPGSPCIDAGCPLDIETDILGTEVPQGDGADIGTYEYIPVVPLELVRLDVARNSGGVELGWEMIAPATAGDFNLTGAAGDADWDLLVETLDSLRFRALDSSPATCGAQEVVYRLYGRREDGGQFLLARRALTAISSTALRIDPVRPNPANPGLDISFVMDAPGRVSVRILDARGHLITTLLDESRSAGRHTARWNGSTCADSPAPSGVYFVQVRCGESTETCKLTLAR